MSQGLDPHHLERSMFDVLVHKNADDRGDPPAREIDLAVSSIDRAGAELAPSSMIGREPALQKVFCRRAPDYD